MAKLFLDGKTVVENQQISFDKIELKNTFKSLKSFNILLYNKLFEVFLIHHLNSIR